MYAIIEDGGRQFKVSSGEKILIDRHDCQDKSITFDRVLLVSGEGSAVRVGTPTVAGATVTAEVIGPTKGPKIDIVKYRRRKGYHKKQGHRQKTLEVRVTAISA
jgi:large subunit ribosomal protein L21